MARSTAPLLSFGASGQIGKTLVASKWKGQSYFRQYVIPSNPNTADQQLTRNTFSWLQNVWKFAASQLTEAFEAFASGQPLTGPNALIKSNLSAMRSEVDIDLFKFSPGAKGGLVAGGIAAVGGALQITITLTPPALPTGWAIVEAVGCCIKAQDPQTEAFYASYAAVDNTPAPYAPVVTGLEAATMYHCGGWFKFTKPDGSFAYGVSISAEEATT